MAAPLAHERDALALACSLRRRERELRRTLLWRDMLESVVGLALTVFFAFMGYATGLWSWFLLAGTVSFVVVWLLGGRWLHPGGTSRKPGTAVEAIEAQERELSRQVRLLRSVLWWYILPPAVGFYVVMAHHAWLAWQTFDPVPAWVWVYIFLSVPLGLGVFVWVYRANQCAVRKDLLPRRAELAALRDALVGRRQKTGEADD